MKIRKANIDDVDQIRQLYCDTITMINKKDYNQEQISIWASGYKNIDTWKNKINEQHFFVAELDDQIIGFSSITDKGYIDYIYTHKDFQKQGIGSELLKALEQVADNLNLKEIWAEISITARPFFGSKGFTLIKTYITKVKDIEFEDSIMTKTIQLQTQDK